MIGVLNAAKQRYYAQQIYDFQITFFVAGGLQAAKSIGIHAAKS